MDKEVYKIRLDKWRKLIYEANTCGMKKTEWCRINGVSTKQFYYWQKRVRAQALEEIQDGTGMDGTVQGDGPAVYWTLSDSISCGDTSFWLISCTMVTRACGLMATRSGMRRTSCTDDGRMKKLSPRAVAACARISSLAMSDAPKVLSFIVRQ